MSGHEVADTPRTLSLADFSVKSVEDLVVVSGHEVADTPRTLCLADFLVKSVNDLVVVSGHEVADTPRTLCEVVKTGRQEAVEILGKQFVADFSDSAESKIQRWHSVMCGHQQA